MNLSLKITKNRTITFSISILIAMLLPSCSTLTPQDHYNLAIDYAQKGQISDAEKEYRNAIQANPDLYQAHNNLGAIYMRQGLLAKAETSFKNALTIRPDYLPALENLASTYDGMGKKEKEALENWRRAEALEARPDIKGRISQRISALEAMLFPQAPKLTILSPKEGQMTQVANIRIEGETGSPIGIDRVAILVNGEPQGEKERGIGGIRPGRSQQDESLRFAEDVSLKLGENEIKVVAYDKKGLSVSRTIKITRSEQVARRYYEKSFAVVIGINRYERWPGLEYAVNDANAVATKLKELGFDEVIKILDKEATRERILRLIGTELPQRVGKNDRLFIFFAGHGQTEEVASGRQKGYIIPVDASISDYFTTAISMEQVREFSERISARHIYYAVDACYSGLGFTRAMGISPVIPGYIDKVARLRAVQMITAGGKGEQVIERAGHGIFTEFLLRGLDGEADMDNDSVVTATELGAFLRPQVSTASDNRQTPQYGRLEGEGEMIFLRGAR